MELHVFQTLFRVDLTVGQVMDDHKRTGLVSFIEAAKIPIPVQFSCWPQLLLSQILLPQANVSFTGHLCGIFAGLLHVFLPKAGTAYIILRSVSGLCGCTLIGLCLTL